jgi:hypothetical protein
LVSMKKLLSQPLAREITLVLLIKFFLIFAIWWAFFSKPTADSLTPEQVSQALLSPGTIKNNLHNHKE